MTERFLNGLPAIKNGDKFRVLIEENKITIVNGYSCVYIKKRFFSKKYYITSLRVDANDITELNKILREFNLKI